MFKRVLIIVFFGVALLVATTYYFYRDEVPANYQMADEIANKDTKTIEINGEILTVEIADEPHEQTRGLSGREPLAANSGMLFIFPYPAIQSFWMKEMKFSLDIIWIDEAGTIIAIEKYVSPDTYPQTFSPPSPVKYVLEVSAGWSDSNGIKTGQKVSF